MVEYRSFRNADPPELRRLWQACQLGRGAAQAIDADVFEQFVFSLPCFDPRGLIVACEQDRVIGYVHAGFGAHPDGGASDSAVGTLCAVMVDPAFRRRGIGRELVRRGEDFLLSAGARKVLAGPMSPRDSFYQGLYGGSQPSGFLISDSAASPFLQAVGYREHSRAIVYQRSLASRSSPGGLRLMGIRRTTTLCECPALESRTWWWSARTGRRDVLQLGLVSKSDRKTLATVTVVGLDYYIPTWKQRAVGLLDLFVAEDQRRKGYGQALVVEVCRRLRDEAISLVEAHAPSDNPAATRVWETSGFESVDAGVEYVRELSGASTT